MIFAEKFRNSQNGSQTSDQLPDHTIRIGHDTSEEDDWLLDSFNLVRDLSMTATKKLS